MPYNILVLGEICLDRQEYGTVTRINPEAPTPVFIPNYVRENHGMAGNIVANLKSLILDTNIEFVHQKTPIIKHRYVDENSGYIVFRVDKEDQIKKDEKFNLANFLLNHQIESYNAVVFSDYCKGFVSEDDISFIAKLAKNTNVPTFLDTKKILGEWSKHITFVKINQKEYQQNINVLINSETILKYCENLILTMGKNGSYHYSKNQQINHSPTPIVDVRSVCGAGDSFLSAMCLGYLKYQNINKAMFYANKAAAIAVSKQDVLAVDGKLVW